MKRKRLKPWARAVVYALLAPVIMYLMLMLITFSIIKNAEHMEQRYAAMSAELYGD